MRIAIVGATGMIGQRILREVVARGHEVTALARNPSRLEPRHELRAASVDATDAEALEAAVRDHDAVVSAVGPGHDGSPGLVVEVTRALAASCTRAGVRRVLVVNGAGSLAVKPGVELLATPEFREDWRPIALAHREALEIWRRVKELDWTVISPAAEIAPGPRTGHYRKGHNDLLTDANGRSHISAEDFAVAVADELQNNAHIRERITFAY
ncbi:MAG: NAD(P)-dependent oxidoreductase [Myxococcota bacterium]